jgi:hypothetical protein
MVEARIVGLRVGPIREYGRGGGSLRGVEWAADLDHYERRDQKPAEGDGVLPLLRHLATILHSDGSFRANSKS